MLATKLYAPTLRDMPADADVVSQKLMLRAGFMRKMAAGLYSYLPLGSRVLKKIETIVREEMDASGSQEVLMPILQPAELWQESGRWGVYGAEMMRLNDRHNREYCLGPTHEELVTALVRYELNSYRQLPISLYQIQNKYRDERRPRYGLMRSREFIMKDAYSFAATQEQLDDEYKNMYDAYSRVFTRCGLYFKPVEADSGAIGGSGSHEFMALAEAGEADVIHCSSCDYAANIEIFVPPTLTVEGVEGTLEKVVTPDASTIEAVANYLQVPTEITMKAVVYRVEDTVVLGMVRGDHEVNEISLQHAVESSFELEVATPEDLERVGLVAGFISPVGLKATDNFKIVVDPSVMAFKSAVGGANEKDMHYQHISPVRDFDAESIIVATIRMGTVEDPCPRCGGTLEMAKGIEVGQVFKLGTKYSEAMNATFLDQNGRPAPMIMGCYGIGVSRTMAAVIEQSHDEDGMIWPRAIAPFEVVIVPINAKDEALMAVSNEVYAKLKASGVDVLLDDRKDRAGVKFKDADLIGYPLRITISKTTIETGEIEIRTRKTGDVSLVTMETITAEVGNLLEAL